MLKAKQLSPINGVIDLQCLFNHALFVMLHISIISPLVAAVDIIEKNQNQWIKCAMFLNT